MLIPSVISECFSQSKEELVIRFETNKAPFFIKASLLSTFSCLSFPEKFHRAKKNSVDLFSILIGHHVVSIRQFENERSFALELTEGLMLLFKMHGSRSNVILLEQGKPVELFKNSLPADQEIDPHTLDKHVDWSFDNFAEHHNNPGKIYFTFGKLIWNHLKQKGYDEKSIEEKWNLVKAVKEELELADFYLIEFQKSLALSLIQAGEIKKQYADPVQAINDFYYTTSQTSAFTHEKNSLLSNLKATQQSGKNYIKKNSEKLKELQQDTNYKIWADLIMANLHQVRTGMDKVVLNNFYNNDIALEIKLKKELNGQKNAEVFYRKSKNQKIEAEHLQRAITQKENEIALIETKIHRIQELTDLKSLEKHKATLGPIKKKSDVVVSLPYHEFLVDGYRIWVGRNAHSNDVLTLKYGYKEDLWLHAKDVAGSHVLIKHQAGKNYPKNVIERAAQLAAYNSKRKNESLCPVIVTPKKFVRKRKGDPPGAVVVEREDVIMVEPKL